MEHSRFMYYDRYFYPLVRGLATGRLTRERFEFEWGLAQKELGLCPGAGQRRSAVLAIRQRRRAYTSMNKTP